MAFGHNVSHSNRKTNRRWLPNIQKTSVLVNGAPRRVNACTRCIRTLRKQSRGLGRDARRSAAMFAAGLSPSRNTKEPATTR